MLSWSLRLDIIKYLHQEFGLTADDARVSNNFALREACSKGYLEIVEYLHEGFGLTADDARSCVRHVQKDI